MGKERQRVGVGPGGTQSPGTRRSITRKSVRAVVLPDGPPPHPGTGFCISPHPQKLLPNSFGFSQQFLNGQGLHRPTAPAVALPATPASRGSSAPPSGLATGRRSSRCGKRLLGRAFAVHSLSRHTHFHRGLSPRPAATARGESQGFARNRTAVFCFLREKQKADRSNALEGASFLADCPPSNCSCVIYLVAGDTKGRDTRSRPILDPEPRVGNPGARCARSGPGRRSRVANPRAARPTRGGENSSAPLGTAGSPAVAVPEAGWKGEERPENRHLRVGEEKTRVNAERWEGSGGAQVGTVAVDGPSAPGLEQPRPPGLCAGLARLRGRSEWGKSGDALEGGVRPSGLRRPARRWLAVC